MIEFLSPEWVEQLDQKLKSSGLRLGQLGDETSQLAEAQVSKRLGQLGEETSQLAEVQASKRLGQQGAVGEAASSSASRLCVQNIVELPPPQKPFRYFITIDPSGAAAALGADQHPSVTFTQPWQVAVAIAQHQRDAHAAFLMGEIKVAGDVAALLGLAETFAELQQIISAVNQTTNLDSG